MLLVIKTQMSHFSCEKNIFLLGYNMLYPEKYFYSYYINREVYVIKLENMFLFINVTFRNSRLAIRQSKVVILKPFCKITHSVALFLFP